MGGNNCFFFQFVCIFYYNLYFRLTDYDLKYNALGFTKMIDMMDEREVKNIFFRGFIRLWDVGDR